MFKNVHQNTIENKYYFMNRITHDGIESFLFGTYCSGYIVISAMSQMEEMSVINTRDIGFALAVPQYLRQVPNVKMEWIILIVWNG